MHTPTLRRALARQLPTLVAAAALTLSVHGAAHAQATSRFVGSWVEDQSKRTLGAERHLTFRRAADGGVEELRGSYARPLVQPVRFGAPPYAVDGSRNTLTWRQLSASQFERAIAQNGRVINTRRIQISGDGKTLVEATDSDSGGKKTTVTTTYRRVSSEPQGLVGVWKPEARTSTTPASMRIEAVGTGLKVSQNPDSAGRNTLTLSFDGKPTPVEGATVISGTTVNARRVNDSTIELAQAREGVATGTLTWSLSADGKTLTSRSITVGPNSSTAPTVVVYVRQ